MVGFQEFLDEIDAYWHPSSRNTQNNKELKFRKLLSYYLHTPSIKTFNSGIKALMWAIDVFRLKGYGKDEVVLSAFGPTLTAQAVSRMELVSVPCDLSEESLTIDPASVERALTDRTCAIVASHTFGMVCDVDALQDIASEFKVPLIYEASSSFGAFVDGLPLSSFGDAAVYSFDSSSVLDACGGGAVSVPSNCSFPKSQCHLDIAQSGDEPFEKMDGICAAFGICALRQIERERHARQRAVERFRERLDGERGILLFSPQAGVNDYPSLLPIVVLDSFGLPRDSVIEALGDYGIYAKRPFPHIVNNSWTTHVDCANLNRTRAAEERCLLLPVSGLTSIYDVDYICDSIINIRQIIHE